MNIAIFGSCVSRDTCEFIPDANVLTYVARHSVTSLEAPHGTEGIDLDNLNSPFQKRMITRDLQGSGLDSIREHRDDVDVVLIDLVDERRGFWLFPDGTTMTNSLEAVASGATASAERAGARLVELGSDAHFEAWKRGFNLLVDGLKTAGLWEKTVMLDIEWARVIDGAHHPHSERMTKLGRQWRRLQRGAKEANRTLAKEHSIGAAWVSFTNVEPTEAETFADRAAAANRDYTRYRKVAHSLLPYTIMRASSEVRIDRGHKWGPQPFHYETETYETIAKELAVIFEK